MLDRDLLKKFWETFGTMPAHAAPSGKWDIADEHGQSYTPRTEETDAEVNDRMQHSLASGCNLFFTDWEPWDPYPDPDALY